jgi:hypothetical protein
MSHDPNKEIQEASLIGRILSIEALLMVMGIASLAYGIINGVTISIFWGVVIVPGVFVLHKVRRKDWTKHWQEMEAQQKAADERIKHFGSNAPMDK